MSASAPIQSSTRRPTGWWLLGVLLVLACFAALVALSRWYTYPDKISGPFSLTTRVRAVQVIPVASGNVDRLYVESGELVSEGELLLTLDNPADYDAIRQLESDLTDWRAFDDPRNLPPIAARTGLGELAAPFETLRNQQQRYRALRSNSSLTTRELDQNTRQQRAVLERERDHLSFRLLKLNGRASTEEVLLDKRRREYQEGKTLNYNLFLRQKGILENLRDSITDLSYQLNEVREKLIEIDRGVIRETGDERMSATEGLAEIRAALTNLGAALQGWQTRHVLRAPVDGFVSFPAGNSPEGMVVSPEKPVLSILPPELNPETGLVAYLQIDAGDAATLEEGLPVRLKFEDYNFREHGFVEGRVERIPPVPEANSGKYTITVDLPRGLRTKYGTEIEFTDGMEGTGEVFTREISFWEMVF